MEKKPSVILAKPGLDGHDKGVRLVAMALREAGFNVHYLGLRQSVDDIAAAAAAHNADFIGLSILSGIQLDAAEKMLSKIAERKLPSRLVIGGIIPAQDQQTLKEMGVAQVFPVGSRFEDSINWMLEDYRERRLMTAI